MTEPKESAEAEAGPDSQTRRRFDPNDISPEFVHDNYGLEEALWFLAGSPGGDGRAAAWFLAYVAAWLGVGAAGIRAVAERRAT